MSDTQNDSDFRGAADLLDELEAEWALIGGQAANEYRSTPRFTADFDFYVTTLDGLAQRLEDRGYTVTKEWPESADQDGLRQIRATKAGKGFDFNLIDFPEYQLQVIRRAQANEGVATIEDLLALKLQAWRDRDRDDIRSVLRSGRAFNEDLVRELADALGAGDRFERELAYAEVCRAADRAAGTGHLSPEQVVFEAIYVDERAARRDAIEVVAGGEVDFDAVREMLEPFGRAAAAATFEAAVNGERRRLDSVARENGREI